MSSTLLSIAEMADEQIAAIKAAFGAPGDWGYESKEGKALYELYKIQMILKESIRQENTRQDSGRFFIDRAIIYDRVTGKHVAIQGIWEWASTVDQTPLTSPNEASGK